MLLANVYNFTVLSTVFMIINYNCTVITMVTFIVQATGLVNSLQVRSGAYYSLDA
jgi:hypothetical protein